MPKHPVDHDHSPDKSTRLREYTKKEQDEMPTDATLTAQREKRERGSGRVKAFTKIDREKN